MSATWILNSPLLFPCELPLPDWTPDDVAAVDAALRSGPTRIGRRFEAGLAAAFDRHPEYEVLSADRGIHVNGRTLGAADLLMRHAGEIWHVELAVKFFAGVRGADLSDPWNWVGPNAKDSLGRKLTHFHKQLALFEHPEAVEWLAAEGIPRPQRTATLIKGILFAPTGARTRPDRALATGLLGEWVPAAEIARTDGAWLPKSSWLGGDGSDDALAAPCRRHGTTEWLILPDDHPANASEPG